MQNQMPRGMKKSETLLQMEAALKKYTSEIFLTEDDIYDADKRQPPRYTDNGRLIKCLMIQTKKCAFLSPIDS